MTTWAAIQALIERRGLPFQVVRFNMSLRGVLVDLFTREAVAFTIQDARKVLRG